MRSAEPSSSPARAALLLVVGSSLQVWPVAGLPEQTLASGGAVAIVNREPTPYDDRAALVRSRGGREHARRGCEAARPRTLALRPGCGHHAPMTVRARHAAAFALARHAAGRGRLRWRRPRAAGSGSRASTTSPTPSAPRRPSCAPGASRLGRREAAFGALRHASDRLRCAARAAVRSRGSRA